MIKNIVLTGGGTAGHVTPNIALISILEKNNWNINYIGSIDGVEKTMIEQIGVPYHSVRSGKLRRYFSWQNFLDPFNLVIGIIQSYFLIRKLKADVIFSKGGFVALPVVIGGYLNRVPIIIHESDMTPGLANKLSFPFAKKICTTFAETKKHFKNKEKVEVVGTPIREELFTGSKEQGLKLCGFNSSLPCLLVMGGGQGSVAINKAIRDSLDVLCNRYQVIHLCGKKKIDKALLKHKNYCQFEYANEEIAHLFAASELVVSRSGANSLCEILALNKPHILVPLPMKVSRGDQVQNAKYFSDQGISIVLDEDSLSSETIIAAIDKCEQESGNTIKKMRDLNLSSAGESIYELCNSLLL
ncbi:MAG: undecaprenyldiphospho-muramoylpentapeptide beta-N-acetylglucosaminyltransferase [Legionellaceae bacterium]|nr:undecaprenyldiphospho-muramoylpentapeptide beta-N-acetylglucosaminyltransferase [Legionellaceae bacterium]